MFVRNEWPAIGLLLTNEGRSVQDLPFFLSIWCGSSEVHSRNSIKPSRPKSLVTPLSGRPTNRFLEETHRIRGIASPGSAIESRLPSTLFSTRVMGTNGPEFKI